MSRRSHRVKWLTFGVAGILLAGFGLVAFGRRIAQSEPWSGVEWVQASGGPTAVDVEPGSPAAAAGLLPGDVLLAIDGRPVTSAIAAADAPWRAAPGATLRLSVGRGETRFTAELPVVRRRMVPASYGYLSLVGVACLASGLLSVFRWPSVRGASIYGALGFAFFAHLIMSSTGAADTLDWVIHWTDAISGALAPALLLHLAWTLSRATPVARRTALVATYAPAAMLVAAEIWVGGLGGAYRFADPVAAIVLLDHLESAFLAAAILFAAVTMALAFRRTSSALHRSQLRWMLWGLAIGFGPFTALCAIPWSVGSYAPGWADLAVLPLVAVPAAFTTAMARYRLHDLDLVLRRGLAAVVLGALTIGIYVLALRGVRLLAFDLSLPEAILGFLAALVAAVTYPTVRTWVRAAVDRGFYRARYSDRATLLDWSRELNAETDLAALLEQLELRVKETLAIGSAAVLVRGSGRRFERLATTGRGAVVELDRAVIEHLERNPSRTVDPGALGTLPDARHLFGMKVKGRLSAVLAIGGRGPLEPPLSSEDFGLLATLCGNAGAAVESARLVLEVRQHAAEVESLKALQESILESSGVGLLLMSADETILAWNRTLEEIYALPRGQALGHRLRDVFPLHTIRRIAREIAAVGPNVEARIYRHALVNRAGERIVVNLALSPLAAEGGDGSRVVTFDDITARVKLEEQMHQRDRLASLGLLAAGVAHEVNTPLTGISSYTQMLLEELGPDDPRRDTLEKIEAQSRRASRIANSLLNLARPERATFEALSINDAVREVLKLFEPQIRDEGIALDALLADDLPQVRGHRGKLQQVLLNLLSNARDAVEGGGRIAVRTVAAGERVVLEVEDDGVGIAEEDLARIFDPFFTTKGRGKGTGLGLSISYGIVREHEGVMTVESTPGEFTRFRVELPVHAPARALA